MIQSTAKYDIPSSHRQIPVPGTAYVWYAPGGSVFGKERATR